MAQQKVTIGLDDLGEVLKHVNMREMGNDPNQKKTARIARAFKAYAIGCEYRDKKAAAGQ